MAAEKVYYATGRRKTSTARVYLKPGKGELIINGKKAEEYLQRLQSKLIFFQPFDLTQSKDRFDAKITVVGGGETGQAGAIRLGVARALTAMDPAWRPVLKKAGLLTRDSREVERKKYGKAGARRRYQYSKR